MCLPLFSVCPVFADDIVNGVGDFGSWATDENKEILIGNVKTDIENFNPSNNITNSSASLIVKVSVAFMRAMSEIGNILDISLLHFAVVFLIVAFAFWIFFESYQMMTSGSDVKKLAENIIKKGLLITGWIIILNFGPAKIFTFVMGPILSVGTYLANFILNSVTSATGISLDSCDNILPYIQQNLVNPANSGDVLINPEAARDIICLPNRMTSFFDTTIKIGWDWIIGGLGQSTFSFFAGCILIFYSLRGIWKFAFIALGIVADLFLAIIMLPFTAVAETVSKTSYKGVAGDIYNTFLSIFSASKLDSIINKFISAAIHFVSLAIIVGVASALMSSIVNIDAINTLPNLNAQPAIILLITLALTIHLITKSDELATKWSGGIETSLGTDKFKSDVKGLWKRSVSTTLDWAKAIKKARE